MPPMYDFLCPECETGEERNVPYAEREDQQCHTCGKVLLRMFPAPMVLSASFPDGHKRKGWSEMREASKLNKESANSPHDRRKEIEKEIKKLGVDIKTTKGP